MAYGRAERGVARVQVRRRLHEPRTLPPVACALEQREGQQSLSRHGGLVEASTVPKLSGLNINHTILKHIEVHSLLGWDPPGITLGIRLSKILFWVGGETKMERGELGIPVL